MKMKDQNQFYEQSRTALQNSAAGYESSSALSLRLCFCVLSLWSLSVCLITSDGYAQTLSEEFCPIDLLESNSASGLQNVSTSNILLHNLEPANQIAKPQPEPKETQTSENNIVNLTAGPDKKSTRLSLIKETAARPQRQLQQARISIPKEKSDSKSKIELYRIIEQINSVEFKPQDTQPKPLIVIEPIQKAEPDEILPHLKSMQQPRGQKAKSQCKLSIDSKRQNENQLSYRPVTEQTLQMLDGLSPQGEQLKNPLELAEILFHSGRLKEAAMCYQQALNRISTDKTDPHKDKAWILFQIGNCLRNDDPPKAIEIYRQLIAEYPDLLWSALAKVRSKVINWYQQDNPEALVVEKRF